MKLRFDAEALEDLRGIRRHLEQHASPKSAERLRRHLRARMERLCTHPRLGSPSSIPEIRVLPPTRYPYRVYYTLTTDAVVILHIRHTSRDLPKVDDLS